MPENSYFYYYTRFTWNRNFRIFLFLSIPFTYDMYVDLCNLWFSIVFKHNKYTRCIIINPFIITRASRVARRRSHIHPFLKDQDICYKVVQKY